MKKRFFDVDVLYDHPYSCMLKMGIPLLISYLVSIPIMLYQQKLYADYAGETYFLVAGLLNGILSAVPNIYTAVAFSAWFKTAGAIVTGGEEEKKRALIDGLYAVFFSCAVISGVLLLLSGAVMRLFYVPTEVMEETSRFYAVTILLYVFTALSSYVIAVVNGIFGSGMIFFVNCLNTILPLPCAYLLLAVWDMKLLGAAAVTGAGTAVVMLIGLLVLRAKGFCRFRVRYFVPRFRVIGGIAAYGALLALQCIFCFVGSFALAVQSNKFLDADYLAVLSVTIPLAGVMNVFSRIIQAFIPVNFENGQEERVKKILRACLVLCLCYAVLCFGVYALSGEAYYRSLFDSETTVSHGVSYWICMGVGFLPVAVLYVIRIFFESIGESKLAIFSGILEMTGMLICAYLLIPAFGPIGRSLASTLGWALAAVYLLLAYKLLRNRIFLQCRKRGLAKQRANPIQEESHS